MCRNGTLLHTVLLWLGLMGLVCGYTYAYTRRLWPLVVAHMIYDFVVLSA